MDVDPNLLAAIAAVRSGELSMRLASKKYRIPHTTLWHRLNKSLIPNRLGKPTIFSMYDEEVISELIHGYETMNLCLDRAELRQQIKEFAVRVGIEGDLDARLDPGWLSRFLKRHNLNMLTKKTKQREVELTEETAESFVADLDKLSFGGYLEDPARILYADSSIYRLFCPKDKKVEFRDGERKEIGVLMVATATGNYLTPMIVYDGEEILTEWADGVEDRAVITTNQTGEVDADTLCSHIEAVVVPHLQSLAPNELGNTKGVVVFDSSNGHLLSLPVLELCRKFCIRVLCVPAGQKNLKVFRQLETAWRRHLTRSPKDDKVTGDNFPRHFIQVLCSVDLRQVVVSAFAAPGIYPFYRETIRDAGKDTSTLEKAQSLFNEVSSILHKKGPAAGVDAFRIEGIMLALKEGILGTDG